MEYETIKNSFPLNVMYRMIREDGGYEVLDGLGGLLSQSQKDWAKEKLLADTIFLLKLRLDAAREIRPVAANDRSFP